jgi:hypothetical protein
MALRTCEKIRISSDGRGGGIAIISIIVHVAFISLNDD